MLWLIIAVLVILLLASVYFALHARTRIKTLLDETLHELNIPLSTILANAKLLNKSVANPKDAERILRITRSAQSLSRLFSELEANIRDEIASQKQELFDASRLIVDVVEDLKILFKDKNLVYTKQEFWCQTDEFLFTQAVRNIIHNALKFSTQDVSVSFNNNKLSITDDGCGLEPEEIVRVFEKYYRADGTKDGKGIGLFIVKKFCDANGVKIFIEQNTPQGTVFTLDLSSIVKPPLS